MRRDRLPLTVRAFAMTAIAALVMSACGESAAPIVPGATANLSGVVRSSGGPVIAGATVKVGDVSVITDAEGKYAFEDLPAGVVSISASAPDFNPAALAINLTEGDNTADLVLQPNLNGVWGKKANLLAPNSEFALAEANGRIYVLGGYPSTGISTTTVQVYDIATDSWTLGPPLPQPNNHGMAAAVNGRIYLIGGQTTNDQQGATAVNSVYELDPAVGTWVAKAPMPTARSGGAAVALNGKIYVAGGRVPRGNDFAVYDVAANEWQELPILPSQRNHLTGAAINGRVHFVGGRLGNGLSPLKSDAHEVYDPATGTWSTAAPMLDGRSGMNSVVANGCYHLWGGESPTGMTPNHDYYDPRIDSWTSLSNMPIPIHGVVGSAFVNGLIWVTGGGTQVGGGSGSLHNQTYLPKVSCLDTP